MAAAPELPVISKYLGINSKDRVQAFIDGTNLMGMLRGIDQKLNYRKFLSFLNEETRLVRASYYALMRDDMDPKAQGVIDMIDYVGYDLRQKWGREVIDSNTGHFRFRGNVIPEITVGMIDAAENGIDHIVMVSGDGEMVAAVDAAKARGCRVTVLGTPESLSDDIRRSCDSFVDLSTLPDEVFMS